MVDILSAKSRSELMSRVRGRDTKPERIVRKLLYRLGYRYRLHRGDLPGKPDIVFLKRRKVVFIHGCFWHGHNSEKCKLARTPKSRVKFWKDKVEYNASRDRRNIAKLKRQGWKVAVVRECELKGLERIERKLVRFLELG